jgi:DNA repair exonuclease SbcCD ATPase subunit
VTETPIWNAPLKDEPEPNQEFRRLHPNLKNFYATASGLERIYGWALAKEEEDLKWMAERALECLNRIDRLILLGPSDQSEPATITNARETINSVCRNAQFWESSANDWSAKFNELRSQHENLRERNRELMANCDAKDVKIRELTEQLTAASAKLKAKDNYCHELLDRIESERKRFAAEIARNHIEAYNTGGGLALMEEARQVLESLESPKKEPDHE